MASADHLEKGGCRRIEIIVPVSYLELSHSPHHQPGVIVVQETQQGRLNQVQALDPRWRMQRHRDGHECAVRVRYQVKSLHTLTEQLAQQRCRIAREGVAVRVFRARRKAWAVKEKDSVLLTNLRRKLAKRRLAVPKVPMHKGNYRFVSHASLFSIS
jgi:hypothetical protein